MRKEEKKSTIIGENKNTSLFKNFYPDYTFDKVENIPYDLLKTNNIKLILLDMDNTLIDTKGKYSKELKKWLKDIKQKGIKPFILSNSYSEKTVKRTSKELGIQYYFKASKPSTKCFERVCKDFEDIKKSEILMIGDQLFTDVWGGNRFGIKTVLVKRVNNREFIISRIKRPFEKIILNHYYKKEENSQKCRI